jgi:hypothetical protein
VAYTSNCGSQITAGAPKAMEIYKLKSSHSMVDVFIIAPIEILEDLVTFKWSKIAKGLLSVSKRKVELMEAEMRAPPTGNAPIYLMRANASANR